MAINFKADLDILIRAICMLTLAEFLCFHRRFLLVLRDLYRNIIGQTSQRNNSKILQPITRDIAAGFKSMSNCNDSIHNILLHTS